MKGKLFFMSRHIALNPKRRRDGTGYNLAIPRRRYLKPHDLRKMQNADLSRPLVFLKGKEPEY